MAITGLTAHDAIGLTLFVPNGRQEAAAPSTSCAFGATSPRTGFIRKPARSPASTSPSAAPPSRSAAPIRSARPTPALPGPCAVTGAGPRQHHLPALRRRPRCDASPVRSPCGATIRTPPQDADWGDRVATIVDPFGHIWALAAIRDWLSVPDYNARGNIQLIEAA